MNELGFLLKKFISFFVEPLGLIITLLVVGIYYFYIKKENKAEKFLLSSPLLLLLFSYPPFANYLIKGLESQYPKYSYNEQVKYIHVLGNGHNADTAQPLSSRISDAGIKRDIEGIIIHKHMPETKIIFTGYEGQTNISNAQMNAALAQELNVSRSSLLINPLPKDTKEEALFTKTVVGDAPFILVTSATHMPRAMMLFKSLGMHPIAAPTAYYTTEFQGWLRAPTARAFYLSTIAIHEYVGIVWEQLKAALHKVF
ncbi:Membrane Protein Functionally coupled to the MukBEF Chromosome Partitioning Mechanism [hydrothermal vent metagenome]|uniref:Membrane Protein Functionally coupled to the MukBEF Chromosome Partitioning Mechanism n=1 Tax=hydrothermal vent metagenome TaxID=652676 RepID=A0A1W1CTS3_9ZZZZ